MVKTHVEESLGANPAEAALNPADSVAMGVQSAAAPRTRTQIAFRAMEHRGYRLLFTAFCVNQIGFWLSHIAMQGLMVHLSDNDPLFLGLLFFALFIPAFLLAPVAGVAADRFDRQRIILSSYAAVALVSMLLAGLTSSGTMTPQLLLGVSLLMGTAFAFSGPANMALAANAVPTSDLQSAVSLQSAANNLTRVLGPAVAAPLVATGRFSIAFGAFATAAIVSGALIMRMRPRPFEPEDDTDSGILRRLAVGMAHARDRRPCVPALLTVATMSFFGVAHVTLLPVFAEEVLGRQDWFAWIVAVTGAGAMIGALSAGFERRDPSLRAAAWRMLAYGGVLFLFSRTESVAFAFLTQFMVGYFYFAVMTGLQTLIQQRVDEGRRGRVMSLFQVCWAGVVPFGGLAMGSVGSELGVIVTLGGAGFVCALYAAGVLALSGRLEPREAPGGCAEAAPKASKRFAR